MFNSVSACTPDSLVSTSFVSTQTQLLNISSNVTVSVNETVITSRPVAISVNQRVVATVTTPPGYLGYEFHEYYLNGVQQYFAVVNKNNYHPVVKNVDATKKWFNYLPAQFLISFYYSTFNIQRPLGAARGIVDIEKTHIVLDHINDAVLFYTTTQTLATRVKLPAGPVEYRKLNYTDPTTNQPVTEAIVLCGNKKLYRIIFNNRYFDSDTFSPTVVQVIGLSGLWYEQDTPTGQSFIDARRSYIRSKLNPDVTALDISATTNNIWIAGYDSVFILNSNFQEINRVILTRETIISLACIGTDAIVTTRLGKAYYVTSTGTVTLIYQASALGNPCSIDSGTAVVIPDPNNQRLLRFNDTSGTYTVIETPDINPAYPRMFDGALWVTGYDSNQVLKITGTGSMPVTYLNSTEIERFDFDDKVTLVSVVGTSILATHCLQEFVTLDLTDITKVIPFRVKSRKGPVSHIGTEPVKLKMLGQESIFPIAGPDLTCWINGSYGQMANTGDYFGVSFKATGNGVFRRPFIVGENAFDYDIEATSSVLITDYYRANIISSGITGNVVTELIPQVGNTSIGYTGPLELGFNWNMYGTTYSNISVSTTGAITFGNTTPNLVPGFGNLNVDALYVETTPVYQRLPITNVNPLNVVYRQVTTTQPMGVYYTSGIAGNFDYFKVRWVGITADPYPDGNTATVTTNVVSNTNIPIDDLTIANLGDYVSGNGITVSTRVTGKISTQSNSAMVLTTIANTNTLVLDSITGYSLTSLPAYSKVTNVATGAFTYLLSAINNRVAQPYVLRLLTGINNNTIYIEYYDGVIDPIITAPDYRAVLPVASQVIGSQYSTISVNITSITQSVVTTPFTIIGSSSIGNINLLILSVDPSFYASAFDGRKVYVDSNKARTVYLYGQWPGGVPNIAVYYTGSYISSQPGDTGTLSVDITEVVTTDNISNVIVYPDLNRGPGGYGNYFGSMNKTALTTVVDFEKVQIDVIDSSIINSGPITIQANLLQVSPNVSVTNGTTLLVKTELPTPTEYTYEVAFYVGRGFQFLEYYYNNSNHSALVNVGVSSSNSTTLSTSVTSGPNNSIVFFSPIKSGNWSYTGPGKIDPIAKIFVPRFPTISNSTPEFGTEARVEFVIDQQFPATANVLMATTFGYLTVNSGVYDGNLTIKENDTVSLTIPFNNSLSTVVPMISIGDYQFAIPMQSISAPSGYIETITSYPDQPFNDYITAVITIPISDSYYVPDYYRASGNAVVFTRTQSGGTETIIDAGVIYDFNAGDVVTVYNQLTPASIYDRREIVLASPSFVVRTVLETPVGPLFDTLDFGTLIEPYVDNYEYSFSSYLGRDLVSIDPEIYETANITLTANTAITGNLYIDMYSSNLVVNGTSRGSYVTNVSTGANISLNRKLMHYFQDDVIVYQVKYDTMIGSNVYIPIGSWNIDNKIISSAVKEKSYSIDTSSIIARETENTFSELAAETLEPKFSQGALSDTDGIAPESMPFDGTYFDLGQIISKSISSIATYAVVGTVSGGMLPSSYINIGSIGAKRSGLYSYFGPPKMTSIYLDKYSYVRLRTTGLLSDTLYTEIRLGPIVPINSDRYSMIMRGTVNELLSASSPVSGNLTAATEITKTSLLEFDITSDITQGSGVTPDAVIWEFNLNGSLPTTVQATSAYIGPESLTETPLIFGSEVTSSFAVQTERFEWLFSDFGVSLPTFDFILGYDHIATSFSSNYTSQFIKTYSYLTNDEVMSSSTKNASYIVNEKLDFVNYGSATDFGRIISSMYMGLDTILTSLTVGPEYQETGTILDSVTLIAKYQGLYTIIKRSSSIARAERKENQLLKDFAPITYIEETRFLINLEPAIGLDSEYFVDTVDPVIVTNQEYIVDTFLPVQDIEPEYLVDLPALREVDSDTLVDLPAVQDIEPEYLVDLPALREVDSDTLVDLPAIQDIEPEYLVNLLPVQDIEPKYLVPLLPIRDIEPKMLIPFPAVLDADIMWSMDPFTDVGAYRTYIRVWANQGRGGDQGTALGTAITAPSDHGNMIVYDKLYNYSYGGRLLTEGEAIIEKGKYYSAMTTNIATTDYWNYRIFFNNRHFCVPRKGRLFPVSWYIRGG